MNFLKSIKCIVFLFPELHELLPYAMVKLNKMYKLLFRAHCALWLLQVTSSIASPRLVSPCIAVGATFR